MTHGRHRTKRRTPSTDDDLIEWSVAREHILAECHHQIAIRHWRHVHAGCGPASAWDRWAPRIGGLRWRCVEEKYCVLCGRHIGMASPQECTRLQTLAVAGE